MDSEGAQERHGANQKISAISGLSNGFRQIQDSSMLEYTALDTIRTGENAKVMLLLFTTLARLCSAKSTIHPTSADLEQTHPSC